MKKGPGGVLLLLVFLLVNISLKSQESHFTLQRWLPLHSNPALTGAFTGKWRASALYRNQWATVAEPFNTLAAGGDYKWQLQTTDFGAGLLLVGDKSGPAGYTDNGVYISGAWHYFAGNTIISVGIQPGFRSRSLSGGSVPSQYDPGLIAFNEQLPNGENWYGGNSFFDANAGWMVHFPVNKWTVHIGQGLQHLVSTRASLLADGAYRIPMRQNFQAFSEIPLSGNFSLRPSIDGSIQQRAQEWLIGAELFKEVSGISGLEWVSGGIFHRNNISHSGSANPFRSGDAFSVVVSAVYKQVGFGLAYDFNVSGLHEASKYQGAFEIALSFRNTYEPITTNLVVPCIRF